MTNDIVKIKSVATSQGGETEHGLMLDSSILSYTYQGSSKTVKWILDTIFTLLGGKAASSTTLAGYGITDAYTKTEVDTSLAGKAASSTTLAGYGITDAYTKTEVDTSLAGKADIDRTVAHNVEFSGENIGVSGLTNETSVGVKEIKVTYEGVGRNSITDYAKLIVASNPVTVSNVQKIQKVIIYKADAIYIFKRVYSSESWGDWSLKSVELS